MFTSRSETISHHLNIFNHERRWQTDTQICFADVPLGKSWRITCRVWSLKDTNKWWKHACDCSLVWWRIKSVRNVRQQAGGLEKSLPSRSDYDGTQIDLMKLQRAEHLHWATVNQKVTENKWPLILLRNSLCRSKLLIMWLNSQNTGRTVSQSEWWNY